jgi:hypothetical protein
MERDKQGGISDVLSDDSVKCFYCDQRAVRFLYHLRLPFDFSSCEKCFADGQGFFDFNIWREASQAECQIFIIMNQ